MTRLQTLRRRLGRVRRLAASLSAAELVEAMRIVSEPRGARARRLERLGDSAHGRIVFVCHGNIMRSAFAAAYLRQQQAALAPRVFSAGTHATAGTPAEPNAQQVARELSVDLTSHLATPLRDAKPGASDVLICMDLANAARARRAPSANPQRVFLIGDVLDHSRVEDRIVHDPYGQGVEATRRAFALVRRSCDEWSRRLPR